MKQIIVAQPDDHKLVLELIAFYSKEQKYPLTIETVNQAADNFPDYRSEFLAKKAEILSETSKIDDAIAVFNIDLNVADDLELFGQYQKLLRSVDRYDKETRALLKLARLNKLDTHSFQKYLLLMRSQRQFDKAEIALDKWIKQRCS